MRRTPWIVVLALMLVMPGCGRPREGALLHGTMAGDTADDSGAQVATNGSGTWVVVWESEGFAGSDSDVVVAASTDGGETWGTPTVLLPAMLNDTADDVDPRIGYDQSGDWIVAWSSTATYGQPSVGGDADVMISRSSDGAQTWAAPTPLNTSMIGDSESDTIAGLATDGSGRWVASIARPAPAANGTWFAHSSDGGVTWGPTVYLPNYGLEPASVASDGAGTWVAAWHTVYPPSASPFYEALTTVSPDDGASWGADPSVLPRNSTTQVGDATWPSIATDQKGHWVTAWTVDYTEVVTATSTDAVSWTAPVSVPIGGNPLSLVQNFGLHLATGGDGVWSLAWSTYGDPQLSFGSDDDVLWTVSRDNGSSWTQPQPLTDEMSSDDGWDGQVHSATDGQSRWVFVWTTGGHSTGPSAADLDIAVLPITVEY